MPKMTRERDFLDSPVNIISSLGEGTSPLRIIYALWLIYSLTFLPTGSITHRLKNLSASQLTRSTVLLLIGFLAYLLNYS
jgi:hypothetical protein